MCARARDNNGGRAREGGGGGDTGHEIIIMLNIMALNCVYFNSKTTVQYTNILYRYSK